MKVPLTYIIWRAQLKLSQEGTHLTTSVGQRTINTFKVIPLAQAILPNNTTTVLAKDNPQIFDQKICEYYSQPTALDHNLGKNSSIAWHAYTINRSYQIFFGARPKPQNINQTSFLHIHSCVHFITYISFPQLHLETTIKCHCYGRGSRQVVYDKCNKPIRQRPSYYLKCSYQKF